MIAISEMTQGELAAYIDSHLRNNGIKVVLSGGASVAIYSDHKYVSKDLDFIAQFTLDQAQLVSVMGEIGFEQIGRYYHHSQTLYYIDFISGPPAVGQDPIESIHEVRFATGTIRIISPTDSVKDRLAAYYFWGDQQSLEQAILVARSVPVDLESVEAWSLRERKKAEYEEFIQRLEEG